MRRPGHKHGVQCQMPQGSYAAVERAEKAGFHSMEHLQHGRGLGNPCRQSNTAGTSGDDEKRCWQRPGCATGEGADGKEFPCSGIMIQGAEHPSPSHPPSWLTLGAISPSTSQARMERAGCHPVVWVYVIWTLRLRFSNGAKTPQEIQNPSTLGHVPIGHLG